VIGATQGKFIVDSSVFELTNSSLRPKAKEAREMSVRESLKVVSKIRCPFCNGRNIEIYLGFRHCKDCDKSFDYSDVAKEARR